MSITRTNITLPAEISSEILQKTQEQSAVMQLARQVALPGRGLAIPVITGDPTAEWVAESGEKPVSDPSVDTKILTPYKLAVIEVFSKEFTRDAVTLYGELVKRLPLALAAKFDATVFGAVTKPGENFDTFADVTAQDLSSGAYAALVSADTDIATNGGIANGYVMSPQGKGVLLSAVDGNGRPLFLNNVAEGAIPMILGSKTLVSKGAYVESSNAVGFVGDWTQAIYGTVAGVEITVTEEATLASGNKTINLWQNNLVGVRAEIELGFRADTSVFNKLTNGSSAKAAKASK